MVLGFVPVPRVDNDNAVVAADVLDDAEVLWPLGTSVVEPLPAHGAGVLDAEHTRADAAIRGRTIVSFSPSLK